MIRNRRFLLVWTASECFFAAAAQSVSSCGTGFQSRQTSQACHIRRDYQEYVEGDLPDTRRAALKAHPLSPF